MQRGKLWYSFRNLNGELPNDIAKDDNKMVDVQYYLENTTPKKTPKTSDNKKEKK